MGRPLLTVEYPPALLIDAPLARTPNEPGGVEPGVDPPRDIEFLESPLPCLECIGGLVFKEVDEPF